MHECMIVHVEYIIASNIGEAQVIIFVVLNFKGSAAAVL